MKNKGLRVKRRKVPPIVNGTTPPRRVANAALRPREYLTAEEVDLLMKVAAKGKECGHRDATMILLAYRHGLRVGELVSVRWDQLDFRQGTFHVRRLKSGRASVHFIRGTELRALRKLQREQIPPSPYAFTCKFDRYLGSSALPVQLEPCESRDPVGKEGSSGPAPRLLPVRDRGGVRIGKGEAPQGLALIPPGVSCTESAGEPR